MLTVPLGLMLAILKPTGSQKPAPQTVRAAAPDGVKEVEG